jgi:cardiolipin synthase A/B
MAVTSQPWHKGAPMLPLAPPAFFLDGFAGGLWITGVLAGLVTVPFVLLANKTAQAKIGWFLALFALPIFGTFVYWAIGHNWLKRRILRLRHARVAGLVPLEKTFATALGTSQRGQGLAEEVVKAAAVDGAELPFPGNDFLPLASGPAAAAAVREAIAGARDHVNLQTYIFKADRTGSGVRDLLVAAAKRGVAVRVLFDALGTYRTSRKFFAPLVAAGGRIAAFLPMGKGLRNMRINLRNHRKILTVDGGTAFTGGMNVADEYAEPNRWHDVHCRIRGPAAAGLQRVFIEDWHFATGELLDDARWFRGCSPCGDVPVQVVTSGPDIEVPRIEALFFAAIAGARKRVDLMTPYFLPPESLEAALADAARRGRRVRLLVPETPDHKVVALASRVILPRVMKEGVEVWAYPHMLHGKVLVVDDAWGTLGSANFDNRSLRLNFEVNVAFPHAGAARQLREVLDEQFALSRRLTERDFDASLGGRLLNNAAALLAPIL